MILVPEGAETNAPGFDGNTGWQGKLVFAMVYKDSALTVLAVFIDTGQNLCFQWFLKGLWRPFFWHAKCPEPLPT